MTVTELLQLHGVTSGATGGAIKDIDGNKYKPVTRPSLLPKGNTQDTGANTLKVIVSNSVSIFVASNDYVYKFNKTTLAKEATSAYYSSIKDIYADEDNVYVLNTTTNKLIKLNASTLAYVGTPISQPPSDLRAITGDSTHVYVAAGNDAYYVQFHKYNKSDLSKSAQSTQWSVGSNSITSMELVNDSTYLYYAGAMGANDSALRNVRRVLKSTMVDEGSGTGIMAGSNAVSSLKAVGGFVYTSSINYGIKKINTATFTATDVDSFGFMSAIAVDATLNRLVGFNSTTVIVNDLSINVAYTADTLTPSMVLTGRSVLADSGYIYTVSQSAAGFYRLYRYNLGYTITGLMEV